MYVATLPKEAWVRHSSSIRHVPNVARDFYVNVSCEIYYDSKPFEIADPFAFILLQDTIAITNGGYIVRAANCFLMHGTSA